MKAFTTSVCACALLGCVTEPDADAPSLVTSALLICDYDPANAREMVDICHDTANAVGGAATTVGPYRHIRTNERGCISGHSGHAKDFTLPPNATLPDPNAPCACGPAGATIPLGVPCCPCLAFEPIDKQWGRCVAPKVELVCPGDTQAACGDVDPADPGALAQKFGVATTNATCGRVVEDAPAIALDVCGAGEVVRSFRLVGSAAELTCKQRIALASTDDYTIRFPADLTIDVGAGARVDEIPGPTITSEGCDLMAVGYSDEVFTVVPDACRATMRTYSVVDWCAWDPATSGVTVGRDEDQDEVQGNHPVWVITADGVGAVDDDGDPVNGVLRAGIPSTALWHYTQRIALVDRIAPVITPAPYERFCGYSDITEADPVCRAPVALAFTLDEPGTPDELTITARLDLQSDGTFDHQVVRVHGNNPSGATSVFTIKGAYPSYVLESTSPRGLPVGVHQAELVVADGCGNVARLVASVEAADCKPPTVVCLNGLAANIRPTGVITRPGELTLSASDLLQNVWDNCSAQTPLAIRKAGSGTGFPLDADNKPVESVSFECGELGQQAVELWGRDAVGNAAFCETYIFIQDNMGTCDE